MNMYSKHKVWIVDDDSSIRWVLARTLRADGFEVVDFEDAEAALKELKTSQPDVLMTDIRMPGMSGLDLAKIMQQRYANIPCIIMTAHTDLDSALASYDSGAFEYLPKPFDLDDAVRLTKRAVETKCGSITALDEDDKEVEIIGEAPAMQEVFRAIGRLAKSNINVMICGQSGTGKELVANALHQHSPRSKAPFVAINIAAIPADLLESELFGHEKGAFTGAQAQRQGRFEQANGGTLFLDEIGEMSPDLQTRLLRVLSDKRFYRVGGRDLVSVDVRVLAATNRNLEERVANGNFREDLYHRLNVIRIDLPSLKERVEDVPLLAKRFLRTTADELEVERKTLSQSALTKMMAYDWPGNVRQLENICRWITVMAPAQRVSPEDLPKEITEATNEATPQDWETALAMLVRYKLKMGQQQVLDDLLKRFEAIMLRVALDHTGGHRQNAAKVLGWGRNTLTRKLKDLEID
jgi:two-component system nitrogen regulation response regulator GlnG